MRKRLLCVTSLALLACGCSSTSPYQTHIAVQAGQTWLDDDWDRFDEMPRIGLDFANIDENGVGAEYGIDYASKSKSFDTGAGRVSSEVQWVVAYLGVRKSFLPGQRKNFVPGGERVVPYIAAGVAGAYVHGETSLAGASDSDDDAGFAGYIRVGSDYSVSSAVFIGIDLRFLFGADVELNDARLDMNQVAAALRLGWSF